MAMVVGVGFDLDLVVVAAAAAGVAGLLVEVKVALVFGSTTFWRETAHNIISGNVDTIRRIEYVRQYLRFWRERRI